MTTFSFILVLALAVIVSALINQVVHGVSTPLIQIAIGVAISFFGFTASNFSLDPELFLVLFIAPLLYDEARQVDKVALWSNRTVILSLAVGLVVATILVVGFMLNFRGIPYQRCIGRRVVPVRHRRAYYGRLFSP